MDAQILDDDFQFKPQQFDKETIKNINLLKIDIDDNIKQIFYARTALYILAVLAVIGLLAGLYLNPYDATSNEILIEGIILISIYTACAFGVIKKPRLAITIGLVVYVLFNALIAFVDSSTLFSGIVIKMVIVFFLVKGILSCVQLDKNLMKLSNLGLVQEEIDKMRRLETVPRTSYNKIEE